jgi:hypothetical protein
MRPDGLELEDGDSQRSTTKRHHLSRSDYKASSTAYTPYSSGGLRLIAARLRLASATALRPASAGVEQVERVEGVGNTLGLPPYGFQSEPFGSDSQRPNCLYARW